MQIRRNVNPLPLWIPIVGIIVIFAGILYAQNTSKGPGYLLLDISDWKDGHYPIVVTVQNGRASAVPLPVTKLDGSTQDPTIPTNPSSLLKSVSDATKAVADPKKEDNAVGIALGYSIVSSRVSAGSITIAKSREDLKNLTDKFLQKQGATEHWTAWRTAVGRALGAEQAAGRLSTKEKVADAYQTIAEALVAQQRVARAQLKGRFLKILKIVLTILPEIVGDGDFNILDLVKILSGLLGKG